MRVLLDHCVDIRFRDLLAGHEVAHTKELGWETLSNGRLLDAAERDGFKIFVTVDKNLRYQQNISKRTLILVTLATTFTSLDDIAPLAPQLLQLLDSELSDGQEHILY